MSIMRSAGGFACMLWGSFRSPSYLVTSSGECFCWCGEDIEIGRAAMVSIEIPRIMAGEYIFVCFTVFMEFPDCGFLCSYF